MADVHVWHGGSDTAPYDTFAKAAASFFTAAGYGAVTDDIVVADDHYETLAANKNVTGGGTFPTQCRRVSSVNRTSGLPSMPSSAQIEDDGLITLYGNWSFENLWFKLSGQFKAQATSLRYTYFRNCIVDLTGTAAFGFTTTYVQVRFEGGAINALATSGSMDDMISAVMLGSSCEFFGTTFTSNGVTITKFVDWSTSGACLRFYGCDLSGVTCNRITDQTGIRYPSVKFEDCEMPTITTDFYPTGATLEDHEEVVAFSNIAEGENLANRILAKHAFGRAETDRVVYRKKGSGDPDKNTYSLRIDSDGNPTDPARPFKLKMISLPLVANASEISVEIARDGSSTPFTNQDAWIEVARPSNSNNSLLWDSGRSASLMDTPVNWPVSSAKWEGLGGTNIAQTLSCSLTGTAKLGRAHIYVCFAVPSDGVNVCMKPRIA